MKPLPKYLYANGKTDEGKDLGAGCIISTQKPLIVGRIILYDDQYTMTSQIKARPPLAFAQIPGYSIAILYNGTLGIENEGGITTQNDLMVAEAVLNTMAAWYLKYKISEHKARFRRYEVKSLTLKNNENARS